MLTRLDRIARFENLDEDPRHYTKVNNIQEIYVGCEVYWRYQGRIRIKGVVCRQDEGYISDFRSLVKSGVLFTKNDTPEEIQEVAKEQIEVKKVKEAPPKSESEQLSLF